jgi:hypothetical protein
MQSSAWRFANQYHLNLAFVNDVSTEWLGRASDRNGRVRVANVFCLVLFCRGGVDAMCTIYLTAEELVEERKHFPADEYGNT